MLLVQITNLTASVVAITDPTGETNLSVSVPPLGTSELSVSSAAFSAVKAQLDSLQEQLIITYAVTAVDTNELLAGGGASSVVTVYGAKGDRGERGEAGPQGEPGEVGEQGPQGEEGPQGLQGVQGPQGEEGAQGSSGVGLDSKLALTYTLAATPITTGVTQPLSLLDSLFTGKSPPTGSVDGAGVAGVVAGAFGVEMSSPVYAVAQVDTSNYYGNKMTFTARIAGSAYNGKHIVYTQGETSGFTWPPTIVEDVDHNLDIRATGGDGHNVAAVVEYVNTHVPVLSWIASAGVCGVNGVTSGDYVTAGGTDGDFGECSTSGLDGGLGSTVSVGQPYLAVDFPGIHGVHAQLRKSDHRPIWLGDVYNAAPPEDVGAVVYGYLSYRSTLGSNLKWRLWYYYRRSSDGYETPFEPTTSLSDVLLYIPEVVNAVDQLVHAAPLPAEDSGVPYVPPLSRNAAMYADISTTSTSFEDTGVTLTFSATSTKVLVLFSSCVLKAADATPYTVYFQLLEGANVVGGTQVTGFGHTDSVAVAGGLHAMVSGLSIGTAYTLKMQWKVDSGATFSCAGATLNPPQHMSMVVLDVV